MPVDKFGHTDVGNSQRVIITVGGITVPQANALFLRTDGTNAAAGDINLDFYKLVNVLNPTDPQDASTKSYVDNAHKKCHLGYIPNLEANESVTGFVATASSVVTHNYQAYGAFNCLNADGLNGSWVSGQDSNSWLQIKCPEPVKIWRIALKAIDNVYEIDMSFWTISGRNNDDSTFTSLLTSRTPLLRTATAPSFFSISTSTAYQYYRFTKTHLPGQVNVGLHSMQLYIYNS
jgi:hypothetical protein